MSGERNRRGKACCPRHTARARHFNSNTTQEKTFQPSQQTIHQNNATCGNVPLAPDGSRNTLLTRFPKIPKAEPLVQHHPQPYAWWLCNKNTAGVYYALEKYMAHVEAYYTANHGTNVTKRVFVATNEPKVIARLCQKFPNFVLVSDMESASPANNMSTR
ncbi:hypothetical protein BIW11_04827 [Tropilaelaps mercedesae]|uniref:Alpha-(1,6)-fucosyltransferase N- and catalytic domain-containing protein n=1 Tax=Tropilaelaps mercedesae TaxID=418985 RepID=A0A1V9X195_9ACAR|nr:hypothetical protein BIW11_04827 [Tropilaelaps mercedesae]